MKFTFLLSICFLSQLYGCYQLRKAISGLKDKFDVKQLKTSFNAIVMGLVLQALLLMIMSFLYFYIAPNLERDLKVMQEMHDQYIKNRPPITK